MENLQGDAALNAPAFLYNLTGGLEHLPRCSGRSMPFFGHPDRKHAVHGSFHRSRNPITDSPNGSSVSRSQSGTVPRPQNDFSGRGIAGGTHGEEPNADRSLRRERIRPGEQRSIKFNYMSYNRIDNFEPVVTSSATRHRRERGKGGTNGCTHRRACHQAVGCFGRENGDDDSAGASYTNTSGTVNQQSCRFATVR